MKTKTRKLSKYERLFNHSIEYHLGLRKDKPVFIAKVDVKKWVGVIGSVGIN